MFRLVLCLLFIGYASAQNSCINPNGQQGQCILLSRCARLYELVQKNPRTRDETEFLRRSSCGFEGKTPKVCCTDNGNSCRSPQGVSGTCIDINSCSSISSLPKPLSPAYVKYLRDSRCPGSTAYSICCTATIPNLDSGSGSGSQTGSCATRSAPPDPNSGCCGKDNNIDRIIGGNVTAIDQYPWLTLIEYNKDNKIKLLCGGVLISQRYVMTAAHCVTGPVLRLGTPVNVRLGEYDTATSRDCVLANGGGEDCADPTVIRPIEQTIPHKDYDPASRLRRNDIALIRLRSLAPYTDFIRPICLPRSDFTRSPPTAAELFAAGWGATETKSSSNVKLHIGLPYQILQECQKAYRNVQLWTKQICAGGQEGKDSCKGDSGGPLMYLRKQTYELIGIVSFGPDPCGKAGVPGVYTNVYEYKDWVNQNIRD